VEGKAGPASDDFFVETEPRHDAAVHLTAQSRNSEQLAVRNVAHISRPGDLRLPPYTGLPSVLQVRVILTTFGAGMAGGLSRATLPALGDRRGRQDVLHAAGREAFSSAARSGCRWTRGTA